jgi:hypothetical protein
MTKFTISISEMSERISQASLALFDGKKVKLAPGVFRASGMTPVELMKEVKASLVCQETEEHLSKFGIKASEVKQREWKVNVTRRAEDKSFVLSAVCIG